MGADMAQDWPLAPEQATALTRLLHRVTAPPDDPAMPDRVATVEALAGVICARPWRRTAVDADTAADMARKLRDAIQAERPVEFAVPFGGYKGWRQDSFPHPDWAELFWTDYLRGFAARIAALHAPGVVISFSYTGGVLDWVNNLPKGAQQTYIAGFERLLAARSTPRLQMRCEDHAREYGGRDALLALLADRLHSAPPVTEADLRSAARNLRPMGLADGPADVAATAEAARRCAVMMSLEARRAFNKFGPRIQLTHIRGASLSLHLGSCRTAVAQPWVSTGYLRWSGERRDWLEALATAGGGAGRALLRVPVRHALQGVSPALDAIALDLSGCGT